MSDKKTCPLRVLANFTGDGQRCIEDKCAWYDKNWHDCALLSLAKSVAAMAGA